MGSIGHTRPDVKCKVSRKKRPAGFPGGKGPQARSQTAHRYAPSSPVLGARQGKNPASKPPVSAAVSRVSSGASASCLVFSYRSEAAFLEKALAGRAVSVEWARPDSLGEAGRESRLKVGRCGKASLEYRCPCCGEGVWAVVYCKDRFCWSCLARNVEGYLERFGARVVGFEWPAHLIVTIPSVPAGELREAVDGATAGFCRLRHSRVWVDNVERAVAAWGLTWSWRFGWHLHQHAIVDARWIDRRRLVEAARRAFRLEKDPVVWIDRADDVVGLFREVRAGTFDDAQKLMRLPDALIGEAEEAFFRRRGWAYFGKPPAAAVTEAALEREGLLKTTSSCPGCGLSAGAPGWYDSKRGFPRTWKPWMSDFSRVQVETTKAVIDAGGEGVGRWETLNGYQKGLLAEAPEAPLGGS